MEVNRTLESGRTGQKHAWHNPDSGANYAVVPTKTYHHKGNPCREFTTTAIIGGKTQKVYGKACRTADGDWKMIQ
jgi:surface antigen